MATHAQEIIESTRSTNILAFIGDAPQRLARDIEREQLRECLKEVSNIDLLNAKQVGAVLYVKSKSDHRILTEWARILEHPAYRFLETPFVCWLGGGDLKEAKLHFFALRLAYPSIPGLCLIDGDSLNKPAEEMMSGGLRVLRWKRYEIENYLLHPDAIERFLGARFFPVKN